MTMEQLKESILSFLNDVLLEYPGHDDIFINPWNEKKFELGYSNITRVYSSFEELVSDPIYEGKTLKEILPSLKIY